MITLNKTKPISIKQLNQTGSIRANNRVYNSPLSTDTNWDICFKFKFPYNVLCNFTNTQFKHQGVKVSSMEGFLQSLKVKDKRTQEKMCTLPGFMAKKVGNYLKRSGQFDRTTVYWQGKQYDRNTKEFQNVISEAYDSKYSQDRVFRTVLKSSRGRKLTHTIGKNDPMDTILTENEFIDHLETLRKGKSAKDRVKSFVIDVKNLLFPPKTTKTIADKLQEQKAAFVNDIYVCGENPFTKVNKLRKMGVRNIIDINATPEEAKLRSKLAQKHKLQYMNITMDDHKRIENGPETVKRIVDMYNEGKPTYIITKEKHDANTVFAMNYLYNPKATLPDAVLYGTPQKSFISRIVSIEKDSDKTSLGWDNSFEETFNERKNTILELNR